MARKSKKSMRKARGIPRCNNWIVVSDLHCGCQAGLCPSTGAHLDGGGHYTPNAFQLHLWACWREFWDEWVPSVTKGEPFGVICNGDCLDGRHHGSTTQISQNLKDQRTLACEVLAPVVAACEGRYYHIRGTEAHVGKSGEDEETVAKELGAIKDEHGNHSRQELWIEIGTGLVHITHHIGTTGSQHYESTAPHKELIEAFTEAGRWGLRPPDIVVRSHRHRLHRGSAARAGGDAIVIVTPGWQGKTPFGYRIAGARQSTPEFGGILIRQGDEDLFERHRVWKLDRGEVVKG